MVRVILLALTFLILFPASSFAAYEIYTYGSGDFVAQTFNALKILFGDGTIMSMIKMVLILMFLHIMLLILHKALTTATVSNYGEGIDPISNPVAGFMAMIRVGIVAAFTVVLFGSMRADVNIIDRLEPGQTQTVSNVPFLNAVVASYSSLIGDKIGSALEEVLTPVDAPRVSSEGFLVGPRYLNDILEITAPGSPEAYGVIGYIPIKTTLTMWFERCIFPNFAYIPGEDSDQAKGLWFLRHGGYLFSPSGIFATSPFFRNHFIELPIEYTPNVPVDCEDAPNQILVEWQNVFNNWLEKDGKKLVGEKIDSLSLLSLSDRIEKIYNRYFASKFNYTFAESMVQIATLNELKGAIMAFDAKWGEGSLQNSLTERTVSSGWVQGAKLFGKVVIYMRQLFEALIYGLSIFLPIAFVVAGYKAIVTFVKINFWLQLWVPGFVLINAFSDWQLDNLVSSFNFPDRGFSYSTLDEFKRQVNLMLGYYGAFMWSIPALAWGLLKGSDVAMGTVMSSLGASGRAQAESVGGQVGGMGNVSVGQQAYGSTRFMDSTMIGSIGGGLRQTMSSAAFLGTVGSSGLAPVDQAIKGGVWGELSSGLKIARDISTAQALTGTGNPLEALTKLKQMGVNLEYDRQGSPIVQGSASGPLPIAGAFNPQTGKFERGIFKVNDSVLASRVNQAVVARLANSFAMQDESFKSWAIDKAKEYFKGQRGQFSETTGWQLFNNWQQSFSEALDKNWHIIEKDGVSRLERGRGITSAGGGGHAGLEEKFIALGLKGKGGGELYLDTSTQKVVEFNADKGTTTDAKLSRGAEEAIRASYDYAIRKSAETTFTTESGYRDLMKLAKAEGGRTAQRAEESWTKAEEYSKQAGVDYTPYLVNTLVDKYFGDRTPENYQKVFEMLRDAAAKGQVDEILNKVGMDFVDPRSIEEKIKSGRQDINSRIQEMKNIVEPHLKTPSGNPNDVPLVNVQEFIKSPDFKKFREKLAAFDKTLTNVKESQDFIRHNTWLLGTLEKLREAGFNPEILAPNLYKAYKTVNAPITAPGTLPKTEVQKEGLDRQNLEKKLNSILGLPDGKYDIWR